MAELMVMDFKQDIYRASEVLNQLLDLNDDAGGGQAKVEKVLSAGPR